MTEVGPPSTPSIQPPPIPAGDTPDSYTATSPDYTGEHAENRILHINAGFFKYGTDDKAHAAAIVLSALLLVCAMLVALIGIFMHVEAKWLEIIAGWLGSGFLFTSGVAVGRGTAVPTNKQTTED